MLFYGKTDVGQRRAVNQDNFAIRKYDGGTVSAVVCDGMGGANGGDTASAVAIKEFSDVLERVEKEHPAFFDLSEDEILDILSEAVTEANRAVYKMANANPELSGMGTTLVAVIISGSDEMAYAVNVGDSRLYYVDEDGISQVSHDHSWVQYQVDIGKLTPEEAKNSKMKNRIYRAVGIDKTVGADLFTCDAPHGCGFILCSDGLTNHVEPEEIWDRVIEAGKTGDIQGACEALIDCANERGGLDNITAVVLSV